MDNKHNTSRFMSYAHFGQYFGRGYFSCSNVLP